MMFRKDTPPLVVNVYLSDWISIKVLRSVQLLYLTYLAVFFLLVAERKEKFEGWPDGFEEENAFR